MRKKKAALFWIVSCTWGLPMTLIGALIALALIITGHKPKRFHHYIYFEVGNGWGGLELGAFFITNRNPSLHIKQHEAGHGIQNIIFGWFMPFVVCIPSAIRYWYRESRKRARKSNLTPYDGIWFECWATALGEKHYK